MTKSGFKGVSNWYIGSLGENRPKDFVRFFRKLMISVEGVGPFHDQTDWWGLNSRVTVWWAVVGRGDQSNDSFAAAESHPTVCCGQNGIRTNVNHLDVVGHLNRFFVCQWHHTGLLWRRKWDWSRDEWWSVERRIWWWKWIRWSWERREWRIWRHGLTQMVPLFFAGKAEIHQRIWNSATRNAQILRRRIVTVHRHTSRQEWILFVGRSRNFIFALLEMLRLELGLVSIVVWARDCESFLEAGHRHLVDQFRILVRNVEVHANCKKWVSLPSWRQSL